MFFLQNGRRDSKSAILFLHSYTRYLESSSSLFHGLFVLFTVNTTDQLKNSTEEFLLMVRTNAKDLERNDAEQKIKYFRILSETRKQSAFCEPMERGKDKDLAGVVEVAIESWPGWDLNPQPLNFVQTL